MYADEVSLAAIAHRDYRKFWAVYVSLLELGPLLLSNENSWLTICTIDCATMKHVAASLGQLMKVILTDMFLGPHDPQLAGIRLGRDGMRFRIFAKLGVFLLDGAAHAALWSAVLDSGHKLCMLCANVYSRASGLTDEEGNEILVCSGECFRESECILMSNDDVFEAYDRVAATWESDTFKYVKQAHSTAAGYRYEPHGLLACQPLRYKVVRPRDQFCHDPAHCIFVGGAFGLTMFMILETMFKNGVPGIYTAVYRFLDGWSWPASAGWDKTIKDVFMPERIKSSRKARTIKCSGSDALALYPLLLNFLKLMNLATDFPNEYTVCLAFVSMCDLFMEIAYGGITADMLRSSIDTYLRAFIQAGWHDFMIPKLHWLIHFPCHLLRYGWLPACWVLERKHKEAKRYAAMAHNLTSYSSSLLCDAICHNIEHASRASSFKINAGLVDARKASKRVYQFVQLLFKFDADTPVGPDDVFVAQSARYGTRGTVHVGDVILVRSAVPPGYQAAEVRVISTIYAEAFVVISEWTFVDRDEELRRWSRWDTTDSRFSSVPLDDIICPCTFKLYSDKLAVVIHPYHVR